MNRKLEIQKVLERLAGSDQKINFHTPVEITPDLQAYLNYYGFHLEKVDYHFGKIEIDKTKIMVQMFSPKPSIGTVILLHGYLDHVGILKNIIQHLNNHQYQVISYDLQGHGLSEGEKASVNSFSDYVVTLEKLTKKARDEISGPFYGIGHSTGGAILINYVLNLEGSHFDKVILIAPLIRSNLWFFSKVSFYLIKSFPFIKKISRHFRVNTSDEQFLDFIKNDPLQSKAIPINWLNSLIHWNKEIQTYSPTNKETLLIQGTKDTTVEWEYNLNFIKKKFHNLHINLIKNGRHELFNEKTEIRDEVFNNIVPFLKRLQQESLNKTDDYRLHNPQMPRIIINNAAITAIVPLVLKATIGPNVCHRYPAIILAGDGAKPIIALKVPIAVPLCPSKDVYILSEIPSIPYHPTSHYDENHQLKMEYR